MTKTNSNKTPNKNSVNNTDNKDENYVIDKCWGELKKDLKEELERKEKDRHTKAFIRHLRRKNKLQEKNKKIKQKYQHKIEKIKNHENHIKAKEQITNKSHHFRWYNFFTRWFYIGVLLVVIGFAISLWNKTLNSTSYPLTIFLDIFSGVVTTVGTALFVGCVFDFSKNSEAFMGFISKLLSDIIVSKTFLASLATEDKKEALKLILQPTNKQIEQYSNINEFFKKKIDDYMKMFDTNFKTNVILNVDARKDESGLVYCESTLIYTLYKLRDEFEPIKLVLEKQNSKSTDVKIIHEKGETTISPQKIKKGKEVSGGIPQTTLVFRIPDELKDCDHLTIKRKMYEPGQKHWINYCWASLTPYESISCHVKCFDGLTIKDFMIFDNRAYYHTSLSKNRETLDITSSQWLEADTGFYITISDSSMHETVTE